MISTGEDDDCSSSRTAVRAGFRLRCGAGTRSRFEPVALRSCRRDAP